MGSVNIPGVWMGDKRRPGHAAAARFGKIRGRSTLAPFITTRGHGGFKVKPPNDLSYQMW